MCRDIRFRKYKDGTTVDVQSGIKIQEPQMVSEKPWNEIDKHIYLGNLGAIANMEAMIEHLKRVNLKLKQRYGAV